MDDLIGKSFWTVLDARRAAPPGAGFRALLASRKKEGRQLPRKAWNLGSTMRTPNLVLCNAPSALRLMILCISGVIMSSASRAAAAPIALATVIVQCAEFRIYWTLHSCVQRLCNYVKVTATGGRERPKDASTEPKTSAATWDGDLIRLSIGTGKYSVMWKT